ncbi:4-alpha-glucanotransferase [Granulicella sp. 5B5]|nr:4-alpha-glucanotransferase [Granulicella sp. 5B5]QMV20196.1 4-alpha-glucanotransferase [Granulicella sp. 5B5]
MAGERVCGILLHVTSLPSYGGVGDFGPAAYEFVDFLAAGKQRLWQVLPLNPTGYGNSPYSALSAFAGNPLLISVELLVRDGWLTAERIAGLPGNTGPCEFVQAEAAKMPLIEEAAGNFLDRADEASWKRFQVFCEKNASWLTDYAMFDVLRRRFEGASWNAWPREYALRDAGTLAALHRDHGRELAMVQAVQFFFNEQWCSLRGYCSERDIRILGDVAIFVNYDSADVWTHPELFELDEERRPIRVSGVPPDYFSATGQRWGNPLYKWDLMQNNHFDWWVARVRRSLALYDVTRLDHFRGFEAYWSIPAEDETAIHGQWIKAPGRQLFQRLRELFADASGRLPFVAEDLGVITKEVDELRKDFDLPGMRVMQFGFADRGGHMYLPHEFVPNCVVYTGTHDNNTTLGWWKDNASEAEKENFETYLYKLPYDEDVVWAMIKAAASSVAATCILPLQDVLHLGSEARMNTPALPDGNWSWRYAPEQLHPDLSEKLAAVMAMTDRDGYVPPATNS